MHTELGNTAMPRPVISRERFFLSCVAGVSPLSRAMHLVAFNSFVNIMPDDISEPGIHMFCTNYESRLDI